MRPPEWWMEKRHPPYVSGSHGGEIQTLWFPRSRVGTHPGTLLRPFRRRSVESCIPTQERGNDQTIRIALRRANHLTSAQIANHAGIAPSTEGAAEHAVQFLMEILLDTQAGARGG